MVGECSSSVTDSRAMPNETTTSNIGVSIISLHGAGDYHKRMVGECSSSVTDSIIKQMTVLILSVTDREKTV